MSLAQELDDALASPRRNPVLIALERLEPGDREAWVCAVDAGDISQPDLARLLTKHTGVSVDNKQVSAYKSKFLSQEH